MTFGFSSRPPLTQTHRTTDPQVPTPTDMQTRRHRHADAHARGHTYTQDHRRTAAQDHRHAVTGRPTRRPPHPHTPHQQTCRHRNTHTHTHRHTDIPSCTSCFWDVASPEYECADCRDVVYPCQGLFCFVVVCYYVLSCRIADRDAAQQSAISYSPNATTSVAAWLSALRRSSVVPLRPPSQRHGLFLL